MKPLQQWLDEYGESHRNPTNKMVHWICVPAIMFSIIGLIMSIPYPLAEKSLFNNWAIMVYILALVFYLRLSYTMFFGFALIMIGMIWLNWQLVLAEINLPLVSLLIFVVAWIGQFWGHKIEGKKPSFFQDLQFLLIGPAWLLHFIYKKLGIKY